MFMNNKPELKRVISCKYRQKCHIYALRCIRYYNVRMQASSKCACDFAYICILRHFRICDFLLNCLRFYIIFKHICMCYSLMLITSFTCPMCAVLTTSGFIFYFFPLAHYFCIVSQYEQLAKTQRVWKYNKSQYFND